MDRREVLQWLAMAPLPALGLSPASLERAATVARGAVMDAARGQVYAPRFFTPVEWPTVRLLADLIVPRDARSGSASDAGVPEFIDFVVAEYPTHQVPVRGGLAWLDRESRARHGAAFIGCTEAQRTGVLDDIAYPRRARPAMQPGVAFFNRFRDLVLSGFWSSKVGLEDLRYLGNTFVTQWTGCPPEVLAHLRVS